MGKARAKVKGKARGPKQSEIPGLERPRDQEIDAAAEDVSEASAKLTKAHELYDETSTRLLELMKKKGLTVYVAADAGLRVDVRRGVDKARVTKIEKNHDDVDEAAE